MTKRAFTIIELLAVVAILGVVMAIAMPIYSRARQTAYQTSCMSNLRLCGTAIAMYMDTESVATGPPPYLATRALLSNDITCDPHDRWRASCKAEYGAPLVGSYGYVRAVTEFAGDAGWRALVADRPNPALFACINHSSRKVTPFKGTIWPVPPPVGVHTEDLAMPDLILFSRYDTSAKLVKSKAFKSGSVNTMMSWDTVFEMGSSD